LTVLLDSCLIMHNEEASEVLPIMKKVPPMMFTVPMPWNILVDEAACGGCVSVVAWLGDCGRRRVMNVSNLFRNFICEALVIGWILYR